MYVFPFPYFLTEFLENGRKPPKISRHVSASKSFHFCTGVGRTEINFVKEISAKAHGDGYMSFSSNFWLDFVTVWGVIRLNLEPTQKADCISRIFIPKIDSPVWDALPVAKRAPICYTMPEMREEGRPCIGRRGI